MNYYFLVASLPLLTPGMMPPLPFGKFREFCREQLTNADFAAFESALDGTLARGFAARWVSAENRLRAAIARHRAALVNVAPTRGADLADLGLDRLVGEAYRLPHPLAREIAFDQARWQLLDELSFGEPFALSAVIAYAIKLRMVERLASFEDGAGNSQLDAHLDSILATANSA